MSNEKPSSANTEETEATAAFKGILTICFALVAMYLLYAIACLWPDGQGNTITRLSVWPFDSRLLVQEKQFFWLMVLGGALGAMMQVLISFSTFVGLKSFKTSWIPWYFLRPFVGGGLALMFYLLLRGGLLSYQSVDLSVQPSKDSLQTLSAADTATLYKQAKDSAWVLWRLKTALPAKANDSLSKDSLSARLALAGKKDSVRVDSIQQTIYRSLLDQQKARKEASQPQPKPIPLNPFGMLAVACLAGLFSKEATAKLEEVFKALFNVAKSNSPDAAKVEKPKAPDGTEKSPPAHAGTPANIAVQEALPDLDEAEDDKDDKTNG